MCKVLVRYGILMVCSFIICVPSCFLSSPFVLLFRIWYVICFVMSCPLGMCCFIVCVLRLHLSCPIGIHSSIRCIIWFIIPWQLWVLCSTLHCPFRLISSIRCVMCFLLACPLLICSYFMCSTFYFVLSNRNAVSDPVYPKLYIAMSK